MCRQTFLLAIHMKTFSTGKILDSMITQYVPRTIEKFKTISRASTIIYSWVRLSKSPLIFLSFPFPIVSSSQIMGKKERITILTCKVNPRMMQTILLCWHLFQSEVSLAADQWLLKTNEDGFAKFVPTADQLVTQIGEEEKAQNYHLNLQMLSQLTLYLENCRVHCSVWHYKMEDNSAEKKTRNSYLVAENSSNKMTYILVICDQFEIPSKKKAKKQFAKTINHANL